MIGFIEHYPASLVPVGELGQRIEGTPVQAFQLRPGDADRLIAWSGVAGYAGADGGVLLLDAGRVVGQVKLGEFLVRDGVELWVETSAADLFRRYQPG